MIRSNTEADSEGAGCSCPSDDAHAALVARVTASFLLDAERWRLSYFDHSATALQRRALAAQNGHA